MIAKAHKRCLSVLLIALVATCVTVICNTVSLLILRILP
jgi:hypothetical protein